MTFNLINNWLRDLSYETFDFSQNESLIIAFYKRVWYAGLPIQDLEEPFNGNWGKLNNGLSIIATLEISKHILLSDRNIKFVPTPDWIVYRNMRQFCNSIEHRLLRPPMPWLMFGSNPINCALSAIIDENIVRQTERVLKFVERGSGVGITLLNSNAYDYCNALDLKLNKLKKIARNGRITVFVPSFHPDIKQFLEDSAIQKRWKNISYGIVLFRSPDGSSYRIPVLPSTENLVDYYTKKLELNTPKCLADGIQTIFRLKQTNNIYLLDGDAMVKHWNKFPIQVKQQYKIGGMCSNLCNEVNLPIDLTDPKFQLCILMGINYIDYKQHENKKQFFKWLSILMKHVWETIEGDEAFVSEMGIDTRMHPIGVYFIGTFNDLELTYDDYVQAYRQLGKGLAEADQEKYFKTYTTIPPGSNVLKNWGLSPPLQRPPDSNVVSLTSSSGSWSIKLPPMRKEFTVAQKYGLYGDISTDGSTFLGSSIEVTGLEQIEQLKKLIENCGDNINGNYYILIDSSKVIVNECTTCQA